MAAIHGSDIVTGDIDITPALGEDNLSRLSSALKELRARVRTLDPPEGLPFAHDARSLAAAGVWNLVTVAGDLNISFVPSGTQGFSDLRRDAVTIEILGSSTIVASLADIIRSKEAAGRPKDMAAIPLLRRLLDEVETPFLSEPRLTESLAGRVRFRQVRRPVAIVARRNRSEAPGLDAARVRPMRQIGVLQPQLLGRQRAAGVCDFLTVRR